MCKSACYYLYARRYHPCGSIHAYIYNVLAAMADSALITLVFWVNTY